MAISKESPFFTGSLSHFDFFLHCSEFSWSILVFLSWKIADQLVQLLQQNEPLVKSDSSQHKRKEVRDTPLKKIMCDVSWKRIGDTTARQFTEYALRLLSCRPFASLISSCVVGCIGHSTAGGSVSFADK